MSNGRDSPDDLYEFAQALVKDLLKSRGLKWSRHRLEDAQQDLFLAGWQVWQDEKDVGLAKNRMVSRVANLIRDYCSERKHEPKASSAQFSTSDDKRSGKLWTDDGLREWGSKSDLVRQEDPTVEEAEYREFLANLPERQRQIVLLRSAGYSDEEIAAELKVSLRTIEREFQQFRKEHKHDGK